MISFIIAPSLKISKKSEYAFKALIELFLETKNENCWLPITVIAQKTSIPEKYLEQILLMLKNAGFLKSRRGTDGGYRLALPPEEIHLDALIQILEGGISSSYEPSEDDDVGRVFSTSLNLAYQAFRSVLHQKTLRELADEIETLRSTSSDCIEYQI